MYSVSLRRQRSQRSTLEEPGGDQVRKGLEVSSEGGLSPGCRGEAKAKSSGARRKGGA